jgi:hemerythrin
VPAVTWSPEYRVGIDAIDEQHRELFARVNAVLDACLTWQGQAHFAPHLQHLEAYVLEHFAFEERMQARHGYPHLEAHRGLHADFVGRFRALKQGFERQGPTPLLMFEANLLLVDWLVKHVSQVDKELGQYVREGPAQG